MMIKLGIIREGKKPIDERVPLSPKQCKQVADTYSNVKVYIQSSEIRRFKDQEYLDEGLTVAKDVSDCDILMGVKEVPINELIANKTYLFFSHTIKKQPYNRLLLQAIIHKNVNHIDYECLANKRGRIVGFGRYAGIVGAYNGLLAYGLRTKSFELKPAYKCDDIEELKQQLETLKFDKPINIALTGRGRVASGAIEVLEYLKIRKVTSDEYLSQSFNESVYTQLAITDYNKPIDNSEGEIKDFHNSPEKYKSDFKKYTSCTDLYISGHFWKEGSPFIFTRDDMKSTDFNIKVVADVSCDIDGPVACTIRPSTIPDPIYGYDPITELETNFDDPNSITVMAVDNLPCELPKDASVDFGNELLKNVLPHLFSDDSEKVIDNATMTKNGSLTERYSYLEDYLKGKE